MGDVVRRGSGQGSGSDLQSRLFLSGVTFRESTLMISGIQHAADSASTPPAMIHPVELPPGVDQVIEIAPGIFWARIPLPFRLDHVNLFVLDDGDGWVVIDTGIDDAPTRAAWDRLLSGPLSSKPITRIIVTHHHPDHIGLAGWLCTRTNARLLTTQTAYLTSTNISLDPKALEAPIYRDIYIENGMSAEAASFVSTQGQAYLRMVSPLPPTFERVVAGDTLTIGKRSFDAHTVDGHAPEQLILFSRQDNILFIADQVLAKITPNVMTWAVEPTGDPLGLFLRSLDFVAEAFPPETLVLPGHQLPFVGLNLRASELKAHHHARCAAIVEACAHGRKSVADLVPILFTRPLDPHQMGFAFGEVHAHVNYLLRRNRLVQEGKGSLIRLASTA